MQTITFAEIHARTAAFHATHNAPAAVAVRAVDTLRAALEDCAAAERRDVLDLLRDVVLMASLTA